MTHLRWLPLLIAAAFYLPHAHAADVVSHATPHRDSGLAFGLTLLIGGGIAVLAPRRNRSEPFKNHP